jgi:hypothetical protein
MGEWLKDLENMERVVEIFELLGGKNEERVAQLVTPYRRVITTLDLLLREAPFSSSQRIAHRAFVFRDMVILGRVAESSSQSLARTATTKSLASSPQALSLQPQQKAKRRSLLGFLFSSSPSAKAPIAIPDGARAAAPTTSFSEKVKLTHLLPLAQCTVKAIPREDSGLFGIQVSFVSRIPAAVGDAGRTQIVTRVEKLELWFQGKDEMQNLLDTLQGLIDEQLEDVSRRETTSSTAEALSQGGGRSWAKNRVSMLKRNTRENSFDGGGSVRNSVSDVGSLAGGPSAASLSLADLESRYNVDFSGRWWSPVLGAGATHPPLSAVPDLPENTLTFSIEFGEGMMGFSLSSGSSVGVLVGKLAAGSFAELGGVVRFHDMCCRAGPN